MRDTALKHYERKLDQGEDPDGYGLSAEYRLGCEATEIAERSTMPTASRYKVMRQGTVERINAVGLSVVPLPDREGHGRIKLGDELRDDVLHAVCGALDPEESNLRYQGS